MKINPKVEFTVVSQQKMEDRDAKAAIKNSYQVSLVDSKKVNQKENDWTPRSSLSLYLTDDISEGFETGKKYKVTFEEI